MVGGAAGGAALAASSVGTAEAGATARLPEVPANGALARVIRGAEADRAEVTVQLVESEPSVRRVRPVGFPAGWRLQPGDVVYVDLDRDEAFGSRVRASRSLRPRRPTWHGAVPGRRMLPVPRTWSTSAAAASRPTCGRAAPTSVPASTPASGRAATAGSSSPASSAPWATPATRVPTSAPAPSPWGPTADGEAWTCSTVRGPVIAVGSHC
jgi:hypothetical protein